MPMPTITIRKRKDGQAVAWFRDVQGRRVRTSPRVIGGGWTKAEQVGTLGQYGLQLQQQQALAGLGSDGQEMPALKGSGVAVFAKRVNGKAVFERRGYAQQKLKLGLKPIRDLYGPGKGGHMLDAVRINYVDDRRCSITISERMARIKAAANERRAPWWGWSPASVAALAKRAAEIWPQGIAETLMSMGLMGANAVAGSRRLLRRVA